MEGCCSKEFQVDGRHTHRSFTISRRRTPKTMKGRKMQAHVASLCGSGRGDEVEQDHLKADAGDEQFLCST